MHVCCKSRHFHYDAFWCVIVLLFSRGDIFSLRVIQVHMAHGRNKGNSCMHIMRNTPFMLFNNQVPHKLESSLFWSPIHVLGWVKLILTHGRLKGISNWANIEIPIISSKCHVNFTRSHTRNPMELPYAWAIFYASIYTSAYHTQADSVAIHQEKTPGTLPSTSRLFNQTLHWEFHAFNLCGRFALYVFSCIFRNC